MARFYRAAKPNGQSVRVGSNAFCHAHVTLSAPGWPDKGMDMEKNIWGLLGPEFLPNARRTRALGLGASVRHFNDLAVPGLGRVWFGKQVLLATLGVLVAGHARNHGAKIQNIEVANAIEALACWLAFTENKWSSDPRLRGSTKLQDKGNDFRFARVRRGSFYVSQPMRMATVQALPALGLVEASGSRFNAFRISEMGKEFVDEACGAFRPHNRFVVDHLSLWVRGQDERVNTDALRQALSPLEPLDSKARLLLRERLIQGGQEKPEDKQRRRNALAWVDVLWRKPPAQLHWATRPQEIPEPHWQDLLIGAKFFHARDAAIKVLDVVEAHIGNQASGMSFSLGAKIPDKLQQVLAELSKAAEAFLDMGHSDEGGNAFCRECASKEASQILKSLVARDGHVLRLQGQDIKPGPAFRGSESVSSEPDAEPADSPLVAGIPLPEGISYRMRNLYLLNLDLHGKLSERLSADGEGGRP